MNAPREAYFDATGANWSTLKHLRDSPMAYRHALLNPPADKTAFMVGRAVHTLVFEPETFDSAYAIWMKGDRRGKAWDAFTAEHKGLTILKAAEADECAAMATAVRQHPLVQPYLDGGVFEQPVFWTDPETGIRCKAKPDWVLPETRTVLDLKSARSIEARRFGTEAARMGYHLQLAHYRNGVRAAYGWEPKRLLLVAVEKAAPHDVAVFELGPDEAYVANQDVRDLLHQLKECTDSGRWPGRYTQEQALLLPAWITNSDDEDPEGFGLTVAGE
ncbi:MAG: PD-(D/E)XK nuclease-like domain-containing protein [Betaproteobacteria bacterium]